MPRSHKTKDINNPPSSPPIVETSGAGAPDDDGCLKSGLEGLEAEAQAFIAKTIQRIPEAASWKNPTVVASWLALEDVSLEVLERAISPELAEKAKWPVQSWKYWGQNVTREMQAAKSQQAYSQASATERDEAQRALSQACTKALEALGPEAADTLFKRFGETLKRGLLNASPRLWPSEYKPLVCLVANNKLMDVRLDAGGALYGSESPALRMPDVIMAFALALSAQVEQIQESMGSAAA